MEFTQDRRCDDCGVRISQIPISLWLPLNEVFCRDCGRVKERKGDVVKSDK